MPVIQNPITEGNLNFTFKQGTEASKYDDWVFYRNQFNSAFGGTKAVDIICVDTRTAWLIEIKDYRLHARTKPQDLAAEVAQKVRDSIAGLVAAAANANDQDEKILARKLLSKRSWRIVLHLEQPVKTSKLRPKAINPADVLNKLKNLLKTIDPHPLVVDNSQLPRIIPYI